MTDRQAKSHGLDAAAKMVSARDRSTWRVLYGGNRGHIEPLLPWPRTAEESRRLRLMIACLYPDPWYKRFWIWVRRKLAG